jgi:hypothetical protein
MKEGKNGVTAKTPKNIPFGPGTIHKGLKYTGSSWNFAESIVGATSGGSKFSVVPEIATVEVDGVYVRTKELDKKTGEKATMEINFVELSKEVIQASTLGKLGTSEDATFDLIESKADIEEGDYWENIAYVGVNLKNNKQCIVIMDNAICTSGLELEGKNKEASVGKLIFECSAELDSDGDTLPWRIYYLKDA